MKTAWNQNALEVLRATTNVFHVDSDKIVFSYTDWEYAELYYIRDNDELLATVREIVKDKYDTYEMCECLDLFPDEYLPFLA